jgi:Sec-independent protein translocase protein TatA
MKMKVNWPQLLFVLYVVAVVVMGAVALSKTGPF